MPSFLKAGFSAASFSAVVPARGYSSVSTTHRIAFPLRHGDRHDLVLEAPFGDRAHGALLALGGERVLVGARHVVAAWRPLPP